MSKPIKLWTHAFGPNPLKVAIFLEELAIAYEEKYIGFTQLKQESFESLNPNGRLPAIEDPNTAVTLFESGAIVEYLVDTYDKEGRLTYSTSPEKWQLKSWLHFQMSGQGPYFGQAIHFKRGHPTHEAPVQIPSAIERYQTEIKRVVGVLDRHLTKQGTGYLVGGKLTYADLAFVPWNDLIKDAVPGWDVAPDAPTFAAWQKDMMERESVKRAFEKRADMVKWFRETRPPL